MPILGFSSYPLFCRDFSTGNFSVDISFLGLEVFHCIFEEVVMTKLLKKTHPGTIISLIVVATLVCLIFIFFVL